MIIFQDFLLIYTNTGSDRGVLNWLVEINCFVILDLIRYPETAMVQITEFRLVGLNDKPLCDN